MEDDLQQFDEARNHEALELAELEQDEIARKLEQAEHDLTALRQQIETLENDRTLSDLRWERACLTARIQQAAAEWFAWEAAAQGITGLMARLERQEQPATLVAAAGYLARLTQGRHTHIWSRLGTRNLFVDDAQGRTRGVDELSRGTREQLFLALRLALVDQLAAQGIELPMVLDDVLVNFDDQRLAAAADVLCEFADSGRQLLIFTSHRHQAALFAARGAMQIELPGRREELTPLLPERLAG